MRNGVIIPHVQDPKPLSVKRRVQMTEAATVMAKALQTSKALQQGWAEHRARLPATEFPSLLPLHLHYGQVISSYLFCFP